MYEAFFGLRERPFDLVPNPRFLYLAARQREALSNLRYGLGAPRGLTLLVGEAGTGKTTLVQAMLSEIDAGSTECVLMSNPTLTRGEFYEFLADGFKLGSEAAASKTRFLFAIRRHLLERHAAGHLSALVLDEAQSLSYELLEEVRLLSNIETDTVKLLNVVLVGQPELADRLKETRLRQLKQRISLRCELAPFDFQETASYIAGRLRIAGGDPARIFSREAVLAIHEASGGVARSINVICDNALIGGFAAQSRPVVRALVDEVCRDFDLERPAVSAAPPAGEGAQAAAPESGAAAAQAAPLSSEGRDGDEAPMFGMMNRKQRFSFF
jgi:general secretion pathway protein A